jgi:alpha-mannosidase
VTCGPFSVEIGENGIGAVSADGIGRIAQAGAFTVGEPVLEVDIGDPWSTRSYDHTRQRLSPHTKLVSVDQAGDSVVITYEGQHPSNSNVFKNPDPLVTRLSWTQVFRLREGVPWLEVETRVSWYTGSRRLRLAFPSLTDLNRGLYGVPYGVVERDRYEPKEINGNGCAGDWPAMHWVGVQAPGHLLAIFERGTPSCRIEDGVITVSVLRSPQHPHCLLEPASYVAYNYNGMTDHGAHVFHHAIYAAAGDWRDSDVVRQAAAFNTHVAVLPGAPAAPLPGWKIEGAHTQLGALKTAEDGKGVVVRLVETAGREETVRVQPPAGFAKGFETDMLEEDSRALRRGGNGFVVTMKPWKIVTLRFSR